MKYTRKDFLNDLQDVNIPHIKDRERYKNFYEELGRDFIDTNVDQKDLNLRMDFVIPKGKILELGCHAGINLIDWARKGFECVGVDISESLIELGKKKIALEPEEVQKRISFINSFIEDLEVKELFDTIVLTETLEHVIDPLLVLKKATDFLKPDGLIYITVPSKRFGNASHVRGINQAQMMDLLSQTDLKHVQWKDDTYWVMIDGSRINLTMLIAKK